MVSVSDIIKEYGQAIRGDWSSIDGRSIKSGLANIIQSRGNLEMSTEKAIDLRISLGICPLGNGQWEEYC